MKLSALISRGTTCTPNDRIVIIDAKTGEALEGVTSVTISESLNAPMTAVITVILFPAE